MALSFTQCLGISAATDEKIILSMGCTFVLLTISVVIN